MHIKSETPPGDGGAAKTVHAGPLNNSKHTPTGAQKQDQQHSQIVERLLTLYPSAAQGTIPIRQKLIVAQDVATARIGDWHSWPVEFHYVHQLAAAWAGRAALSPWPLASLEQATDACRHLLTATLILRRLGDTHGSV